MKVKTIGVDLAKSVFQVYGVDERGHRVLSRRLNREQVMPFFANLAPCLVGMEACGGAHYWAHKLTALGHTVKLMAPKFVKPYVKTNKNDARDAEAICEAVTRPSMRFVPLKAAQQLAVQGLHRAHQAFLDDRTEQANRIRGLLAEFGIVLPKGVSCLPKRVPAICDDETNGLPPLTREIVRRLLAQLRQVDEQAKQLDKEIGRWGRDNPLCRLLTQIPGIGPVTASALVAAIGNGTDFRNGRHLAAWLGLVPRQHSSGGRTVLLGISKHGDSYLRGLFIHGARAVLSSVKRKRPGAVPESWLTRLMARRHFNVATVALANKNARIAWAMLAHGECFNPHHHPTSVSPALAEASLA